MTHQTFPKPTRKPKAKNRTVTKRRQAKRRKSEKVKLSVYERVDERDGLTCVPCGYKGRNTLLRASWWKYLQHHHIVPRSLGGAHTTANICTVCPDCHKLIHDKKLLITGNANAALVISWR